MNLSAAIVSLFIATGASLPAFGAIAAPISTPPSLHQSAVPRVEAVKYRPTNTREHRVAPTHRDSAHRTNDWTAAGDHPGWPCVHNSDPTFTSSFPSWEVGSGCR
jgi:hypothetical protein